MSLDRAREVIDIEAEGLRTLRAALDESYLRALDLLEQCAGRVVVIGMGKAGHVGAKIAATLASTGTPAFFMHPAEAMHGDLGMVTGADVCLIISNSGESAEITHLLPYIRRKGAKIVGITGNARSTMAGHCDVLVCMGTVREACPMGLAPTASTTAMLALGDAIAMCLMGRKGFTQDDWAVVHPAGALGRRVAPIESLMRIGDGVARVHARQTVQETLFAMTRARAGSAVVVDADGRLEGIFCDGDLRRGLEKDPAFLQRPVGEVMIRGCKRVPKGTLADDVLQIMRQHRIADVPVVDPDGRVAGVADLKGLVASL